ncbi:ribbon-helix-helix domain-containing protein [Paracoccus aminophilus]|uniref:Ribbon-helix-helix domain-containing protein n=1 Tax=Paracoccus aminophilus JCM 7686 TaxID=1367847 RepID=S5YRV8_PARAH|nr:ribbon-helix-helix domain-containing protein [Paracoccus aminophilus]AGT07976.1 hypothetical protein JCM7686_0867 [Paracoccus aminophilus JCM 7686]
MIDLPPLSAPAKHSVTIDGHRTSVSLEEAFWRELRAIAQVQQTTPAALIAAIDHQRPPEVGLATAIRLYVLAEVKAGRNLAATAIGD